MPISQLKISLLPVPLGSKDSSFFFGLSVIGEVDILSYSQLNKSYFYWFLREDTNF